MPRTLPGPPSQVHPHGHGVPVFQQPHRYQEQPRQIPIQAHPHSNDICTLVDLESKHSAQYKVHEDHAVIPTMAMNTNHPPYFYPDYEHHPPRPIYPPQWTHPPNYPCPYYPPYPPPNPVYHAPKQSRIRPKSPSEVLHLKLHKNTQSRERAALLRSKIDRLRSKPAKTEQEAKLLDTFQERRERKNTRSKQRAAEKKKEVADILNKLEGERSEEERRSLEVALAARRRKNEGDRLRRVRLKEEGKGCWREGGLDYGPQQVNGYYGGYYHCHGEEGGFVGEVGELEDKFMTEEVEELLLRDVEEDMG